MAADIGFVADAAERDADEFAAHGPGDGFAEAGFADAGRADKAEDGAFAVRVELADGQKFENAAF